MKRKKQQIELTPCRDRFDPFGKHCKVYNDGKHFVARQVMHHDKKIEKTRTITDEDRYFDELYLIAVKSGLKHNALREYLKAEMQKEYPTLENLDDFVNDHIKAKIHNFYSRLKRFKRKAYLNKWNYFVTITYDDKKHNAESFRRKLRKCLSNLHCRRGWNYMGVFELAPDTQRLHFHALIYVPMGQMIGSIQEVNDYSTAQHKMQTSHSNDFFATSFGRNDFAEITEEDIKLGNTADYLTKYLMKTSERIVYSRGIPTELSMYIENQDIATKYMDFFTKFVLFDDCIDSNNIYTAWRPPKYYQPNFLDNVS